MPTDIALDPELPSLNRKALDINLEGRIYGTFAEIGAGQEVARIFFRAGGASGTIAKSMCAYDMTFSDTIYGKTERYVSRERLDTMLEHEYNLLIERLGQQRGATTCFFAFANTVATTSYGSNRDGEGWIGLRFQSQPGETPSEIVIHCHLLDDESQRQQLAIGAIGTNLIHSAFYLREEPAEMLQALLDHVGNHRAEIDMLEVRGPAFAGTDNRELALQLVKLRLTNAVLFSAAGKVIQPSAALYKKAVLVQRGRFRPLTYASLDMMQCAMDAFCKEPDVQSKASLTLLEMTINNLLGDDLPGNEDFLDRVDMINALGYPVLVSNYPEYYRLATYFRRYTREKVGIVMGINNLLEIFNDHYYSGLAGGILEAFGRLFKNSVTLYVYPMQRSGLERYRRFAMTQALLESAAKNGDPLPEIVNADNVFVDEHLKHLFLYLRKNGSIRALEGYQETALATFPQDIIDAIVQNEPGWQQRVPDIVADHICRKNLFGYGNFPH
jgi:hypothetical protein